MRKMILILAALLLLAAACSPSVETTEVEVTEAPEAAVPSGDFVCEPSGDAPGEYDAPAQVIEDGKDYVATITMEDGGEIVLDLFPAEAPITVNNFVFLACEGFYDGVTFHRVLPGFMAQGGDPTGTGMGGPGYAIQDEHENGLVFDRPGLVSMAHTAAPNSAGSQFFITYSAESTQHLSGTFTIFGEVIEGMDVVEAITPRDPSTNPNAPAGDAIQSIRVTES